MKLPVQPPVSPMLAKLAREIPLGDLLYEPKWDGFRCLVFRDGDELFLQSRNGKPLDRYFPELQEPLRTLLPPRCVIDGELVVPRDDRLDFDALTNRIHPAASRVAMLAEAEPAHLVAFDVLALEDRDLMDQGAGLRRELLLGALDRITAPVHVSPATDSSELAADWFHRFEGAGLDGVIAKPTDGVYAPGKRTQHKIKHQRTADVVVGGFRWHKDGEGVGSLLLGLYDDEGRLRHIGVASSFSAARRRELADELTAVRQRWTGEAEHPWITAEADTERSPRDEHRWSAGKSSSWEPLPLVLVAEVAYEQLQGDRLRHGARLLRWRPDRDPDSCRYDQLEEPAAVELQQLFDLEDRSAADGE